MTRLSLPPCALLAKAPPLTEELDGLSKSNSHSLASSARTATAWLDDKARGVRVGRGSRLRIESRSERASAAIETHEGVGTRAREDDAILSCCLFFARAAPVILWTDDRNLALLAEGSGVHTLVGRGVGLVRLLRETSVPLDADEAMELDEEIVSVPRWHRCVGGERKAAVRRQAELVGCRSGNGRRQGYSTGDRAGLCMSCGDTREAEMECKASADLSWRRRKTSSHCPRERRATPSSSHPA